MPQDAYTLKFLCKELNDTFSGGKINRIIQPTADEAIFTVYNGKGTERLYMSVNPACPRIGITTEERESPLTAPNFCMLLRKHLLNATIDNISLVGFDRIVKIDITASSEFFDAGKKVMYIELMGRYSNIILTENGKVLGGNRGVNFFDNGIRPLIVGREYKLPPTQDKLLPNDKNLVLRFDAIKDNIAEVIKSNAQGIGAETAKEIEKEYKETYKSISATSLFDFLNRFITEKQKKPCIIYENGKVKDVCVFPYQTITGEVKLYSTLLQAENDFFSQKEKTKRFATKKESVSAIVSAAIKKVKKRLNAINARLSDAYSAEENKIKGELILANIYKIRRGDNFCEVDNYYNGEKIKISLDSTLTPAENAERYYKKYNKAKRTIAAQEPQKQLAIEELNYLQTVSDEIDIAETEIDIALIKDELKESGIVANEKTTQKRKEENIKYKNFMVDGFMVRVGRNNVENDELTFSAKGGDLWLHAKDYHSSHIIIETNGKEVPEKVILTAAEICAYYSKGRDSGKVEIVYTKKKYVKKPPKSKLGFCIYTDFKSVIVKPVAHAELLK